MKIDLHVLYPNEGPSRIQLNHELPDSYLNDLVGGLIQIVPAWDQFVTYDGKLVHGLAYCNEEATLLGMPDNHWASALWHYVLRAKGEKRLPLILRGPIVFVSGDDEFMETL